MFSKYMRGWTVAVNVRCGEYEGETEPKWIRGTIETPWLDVSATINEEGIVSMAVVNVSDSKDFSTKLEGVSSDSITVYTVTGDNPMVANTSGNEEEVIIKETKWDGKGEFTFPKHSVTMLRWKA